MLASFPVAEHYEGPVSVQVVDWKLVNAFAAPGGYIGVNSGLILATGNESQLAGVMAHEIAHVTQRHIARAIALNERSNIATLAGILAAIAIGTKARASAESPADTALMTRVKRRDAASSGVI